MDGKNLRPAVFAVVCGMLLSMTGISARAAELVWSEDIESSLRQAAEEGRPVLMEFTASWCVYCKRMEKSTFADPAVISRISENFVAVRVDADKNKELVAELGIKGLPAILIVSPELQIQERISGFQTAEALVARLDQVTSRSAAPADQPSPANPRATAKQPTGRPRRPGTVTTDPSELSSAGTSDRAAAPARRGIHPVSKAAEAAEAEFGEDPAEPQSEGTEFTDEVAEEPAPKSESDEFLESIREERSGETSQFAGNPAAAETRTAAAAAAAVGHSRRTKTQPAAFAGQCLVSAVEDRELIPGTSRSQAEYRGKVLYFRSEKHKQRFLADPEKYWPVLDGNCAMTLLNEEVPTEGQLQFAAVFRKQIWLFTSEQHMKDFLADPAEVAEEIEDRAAGDSAR